MQYDEVKHTKGVNFVGEKGMTYSFIAFKVGKWDEKLGKNFQNPHAKMIICLYEKLCFMQ